jgi:hypothetical protein
MSEEMAKQKERDDAKFSEQQAARHKLVERARAVQDKSRDIFNEVMGLIEKKFATPAPTQEQRRDDEAAIGLGLMLATKIAVAPIHPKQIEMLNQQADIIANQILNAMAAEIAGAAEAPTAELAIADEPSRIVKP